MKLIRYIIIFIIFSLLGWIYEYTFLNGISSDLVTKKIFNIDLPILPIYGFAGVILLLIHENYGKGNIILKTFMATIILSLFECFAGLASYRFHKVQTWKYTKDTLPLCNGYISVKTSLWWTFLSLLFFATASRFD